MSRMDYDADKALTSDEIKHYLVQMMECVHQFCETEGITYYLAYGTLLGAVRHKGFIPWDDDMDISLPRKDYQRFIALFNSTSDRYKVVSMYDTEGYYLPFAKVIDTHTLLREEVFGAIDLGLGIDLFPLDNMGDNMEDAVAIANAVKPWRKLVSLRTTKVRPNHPFYKRAVERMWHLIPRRLCLEMIDKHARKLESENKTKYSCVVVDMTNGVKDILETNLYTERVLLAFEGHLFWGPKAYDDILINIYGNYMELPPVEERVTHHAYSVYKVR